jgi:trk system potassium uptake protein TrkA
MKRRTDLQFAVIGLGAFGNALAKKLSDEGAYVIAIDNNMEHIDRVKDFVSDAICFDATDQELLENHGITNVDVAIISIGESFEPVVLISMHLLNAGVKEVYGRAGSYTQEQILKQIGITEVIHPERQVAERMGVTLVRRGLTDVFNLGGGLAMFEIEAPKSMVGYTLKELELRKRYQLNLITIKRIVKSHKKIGLPEKYEVIGVLDGNTVLKEGDRLLLVGNKNDVDKMLEIN